MEEVNILHRIANKDEKALEELYDRYDKVLYSLIYRIVKNKNEVEEIMQDLFLKIWENAYQYDPSKGSLSSWLITLSRNMSIDRIRSKDYKKNIKEVNLVIDLVSETFNNENMLANLISKEQVTFVKKAILNIPVEQKKVLEMHYFEGLTHVEISDELKTPLGTVKSRMRQALVNLHKQLYKVYK